MVPALPKMSNRSRIHRSPGEYYKVKLRTASGTSLTIRYRKRPDMKECCSGESCTGSTEASRHSFRSEIHTNIDVDQTFEKLTDLKECKGYSYDAVSQERFEVFYDSVEPDFSAYHFWASDDCTTSDASNIGSNENFAEIPDALNVPAAPAMDENFIPEPAFDGGHRAILEELCENKNEACNTILLSASMDAASEGGHDLARYSARLSPEDQVNIECSDLELIHLPSQLQIEASGTILHVRASQYYEESEKKMDSSSDPSSEGFSREKTHNEDSSFLAGRKPEEAEAAKLVAFRSALSANVMENVVLPDVPISNSVNGDKSLPSDCFRAPFARLPARNKRSRKKRAKRANPSQFLISLLAETSTDHDQATQIHEEDGEGSKISRKQEDERHLSHSVDNGLLQLTKGSVPCALGTNGQLDVPASSLALKPGENQKPRSLIVRRHGKALNERVHEHIYRSIHETINRLAETASNDLTTNNDLQQESGRLCLDCTQRNDDSMEMTCSSHRGDRRRRGKARPKTDFPRKKLLPEGAVNVLRQWLDDHIGFPFADKEEKKRLVSTTGLTLSQVENWLSNTRHKMKLRRSFFEEGELTIDVAGMKGGRGKAN